MLACCFILKTEAKNDAGSHCSAQTQEGCGKSGRRTQVDSLAINIVALLLWFMSKISLCKKVILF